MENSVSAVRRAPGAWPEAADRPDSAQFGVAQWSAEGRPDNVVAEAFQKKMTAALTSQTTAPELAAMLKDAFTGNSFPSDSVEKIRFATKITNKPTNLTGASLRKTESNGVDYADAILDGANFTLATAINARFERTNLSGAILLDAKFSGSNLHRARSLHELTIDDQTTATLSRFSQPAIKTAAIFS